MKYADVARLKDVCEIRTNFPEADFWITRRGSEATVGTPTKTFSPEAIGVKVTHTEILLPDYLFYWFQHIHSTGFFKRIAHGTLKLVNIKTDDIKNIPIAPTSS